MSPEDIFLYENVDRIIILFMVKVGVNGLSHRFFLNFYISILNFKLREINGFNKKLPFKKDIQI